MQETALRNVSSHAPQGDAFTSLLRRFRSAQPTFLIGDDVIRRYHLAMSTRGFVILSGQYRGLEEVRRLFESVWEISEWFVVEPGDPVEIGDSVVIPLDMRARARATGIEGSARTVHRWTMRDGRATRLQVFADGEEALAAQGGSR